MKFSLENFIFSYIFCHPPPIALSVDEQKKVAMVSAKYMLSGFLLSNSFGDGANEILKLELVKEAKVNSFKRLQSRHDYFRIRDYFHMSNINFIAMKGIALSVNEIYEPGERTFRDIDILVTPEDIERAYKALKALGFKYQDENVADQAVFLWSKKRHLPRMQNSRGTAVELHWRITLAKEHNYCPIADHFFKYRLTNNESKNFCTPSLEGMIAHIMYHTFCQRKVIQGPVFLFDLLAIHRFNGGKWPTSEKLLEKLGLIQEYKNCTELLELTSRQNGFSLESMQLAKTIFRDPPKNILDEVECTPRPTKLFGWKDNADKSSLFRFSELRNYYDAFRYKYQIKMSSYRFWFILFRLVTKKLLNSRRD